jgi:hypothetical protein
MGVIKIITLRAFLENISFSDQLYISWMLQKLKL